MRGGREVLNMPAASGGLRPLRSAGAAPPTGSAQGAAMRAPRVCSGGPGPAAAGHGNFAR